MVLQHFWGQSLPGFARVLKQSSFYKVRVSVSHTTLNLKGQGISQCPTTCPKLSGLSDLPAASLPPE